MDFNKTRLFVSLLPMLLLVSFIPAGYADPTDETSYPDWPQTRAAIEQTIRNQGGARVIVTLKTPQQRSTSGMANPSAIAGAQGRVLAQLSNSRRQVFRRGTLLPYMALEVDADTLAVLESSPDVESIEIDRLHKPTLLESIPQINADLVHDAGYTGAGQTVAILDSGVEAAHAFFGGRVVQEACFSTNYAAGSVTSLCPGGVDTMVGPGAATPCTLANCSHGTHVAGIAAGNSATRKGVAPQANIIAVQVFSRIDSAAVCGSSRCIGAYTSDITAGLEYVNTLAASTHLASVNLSMGLEGYSTAIQCSNVNASISAAIDALSNAGVATVIAAGNDGDPNKLSTPGCLPNAISVGSVDGADGVSSFSNSANWLSLLAPGTSISSSVPGGNYGTLSGTSMATPHVSGAYAVLRAKDPGATLNAMTAALTMAGKPVPDARNGLTQPRIDLKAAVDLIGNSFIPVDIVMDDEFDNIPTKLDFVRATEASAYRGRYSYLNQTSSPRYFTPVIPTSGLYRLSAWWPNLSSLSTQATIEVNHNGGITTFEVDQSRNGGKWVTIGEFNFTGGTNASVSFANLHGDPVAVDGVRLQHIEAKTIQPLRLLDEPVLNPPLNLPYAVTLGVEGGLRPQTWSISSGTLPTGLHLSVNTGEITGTVIAPGRYPITVEVRDQVGGYDSRDIVLDVAPSPTSLVMSADSRFTAYLDGDYLMAGDDFQQAGQVLTSLTAGPHVIAVKAEDFSGLAGFIAQIESDGLLITSDASWKVSPTLQTDWERADFDDSAWELATSYGAYGVAPWYRNVAGLPNDSTAQWIWTDDNTNHTTAYFRYEFVVADNPNGPLPTITTTSLPDGNAKVAYAQTLQLNGGIAPYSWSIISGTLPFGLVFNSDSGTISGTPTTVGTSNFTVQVWDSIGQTGTKELSITIYDYWLTIKGPGLSELYINGVSLEVKNYLIATYFFRIADFAPISTGQNTIAVRAASSNYGATLIAEVHNGSEVIGTSSADWKVSRSAPTGWEQPGFNDIAWAPATNYGTYLGSGVFYLSKYSGAQWIWTNDNNEPGEAFFRFSFSGSAGTTPPSINTLNLTYGAVGTSYFAILKARNGSPLYSWSLIDGSLPAGLSLSEGTGYITGTPTTAGTSTFTVQVTDSAGLTNTQTFNLTIAPPASTDNYELTISSASRESTYFNGKFMGYNSSWGTASRYPLATAPGKNTIAVRAESSTTLAGVIAELRKAGALVSTSGTNWKVSRSAPEGWEHPDFDDSDWTTASSYGVYGVDPWGKQVSNIPNDSTAEWIWAEDIKLGDTVYLRYTFSPNGSPTPPSISTSSLPGGTVGTSYSQTLQARDGLAPLAWSIVSGTLPQGLSLDAASGTINGTPSAAGTSSFTVQVRDSNGQTATKALSISVAPSVSADGYTLVVSTDNAEEVYFNGVYLGSSDNWTVGSLYALATVAGKNTIAVRASDAGGTAALIAELRNAGALVAGSGADWKVSESAPAGWEQPGFDDSGWSPATSFGAYGVSPWSKRVSKLPADSTAQWIWAADNSTVDALYLRFSFSVGGATPPPSITSTALPGGSVGEAYAQSVQWSGGSAPFTWSVVSGALPEGLFLDAASGTISGTPSAAGTATFTVQVQDNAGLTDTQGLSIAIAPAAVANDYSLVISTDNGEEVYFNGAYLGSSDNWTVGSLYALATVAGENTIAVRASDAGGIAALIAELRNAGAVVATSGSDWKVSASAPAGWERPGFDDSGWGPATSFGVYGVGPWGKRVSNLPGDSSAQWIWAADNSNVNELYLRFSFLVDGDTTPPSITTTALPAGTVGENYRQTLQLSDGNAPFTWSIVSGALPEGLLLDAASGTISGTPSIATTANFTVQVEDNAGLTDTQGFDITIVPTAAVNDYSLLISTDNGEAVYFNGAYLGSSDNWTVGSLYPLAVLSGRNTLAVKASDAGGIAAMIAELRNAGVVVASSGSGWKVSESAPAGWEQPDFDDSTWEAATGYGSYGVSPWGKRVSGLSSASTAQWIWSADNWNTDTLYLRFSFETP